MPGVPTTAVHHTDLAHHTSGHEQCLINSQPCLVVQKPGGLSDPLVAPKECDPGGMADSVHLHISHCLAEHVQTVRGGSCPGMSGHNGDSVEARNVNSTECHAHVHSDEGLLCAQCRGAYRGGLCGAGGTVAHCSEIFDTSQNYSFSMPVV